MEKVLVQDVKPYCFGLKNVPFFETGDCNICSQVKECVRENHQSVKVLK